MKDSRKSAKTGTKTRASSQPFSAEERAAAKARVQEMKAGDADGESLVLSALAGLPEADRALGKRLHSIIKANAPSLSPKTWYGMPAYARQDGKVVCHFQPAQKFKTRYATIGFSDQAKLDDGNLWPVAYAVTALTEADEKRIAGLLKKAVG
jgi:uncharacterized protein YdhG (YjbR/CyaY superfamily)